MYSSIDTLHIDTYGHAPAEILQATCPGCHARPLWVIYNLYISMITMRGAVQSAQSAVSSDVANMLSSAAYHASTHTQPHIQRHSCTHHYLQLHLSGEAKEFIANCEICCSI